MCVYRAEINEKSILADVLLLDWVDQSSIMSYNIYIILIVGTDSISFFFSVAREYNVYI